jgi:hypothetical protein
MGTTLVLACTWALGIVAMRKPSGAVVAYEEMGCDRGLQEHFPSAASWWRADCLEEVPELVRRGDD